MATAADRRDRERERSSHSPTRRRRRSRSSSLSPRSRRLRRAQEEREEHHGQRRTEERERERDRSERGGREELRKSSSSLRRGGRSSSPPEERGGRRDTGGRSRSPLEERRGRAGEGGGRSRSPNRRTRSNGREARDEVAYNRGAVLSRGDDDDSVSKMNAAAEELDKKEKQKPSFELSGKLAEETNRLKGVTLLHTEPPEARKPDTRWRLYVFKSGDMLNEPYYVHRLSCYLFGRERRVADIPTDHPSCSKQHAVLQYRLVEKEQASGLMKKQVRPYLMDLDSTNGTFINGTQIESRRYYELFEKDMVRFGNSSREYVLLHENSQD